MYMYTNMYVYIYLYIYINPICMYIYMYVYIFKHTFMLTHIYPTVSVNSGLSVRVRAQDPQRTCTQNACSQPTSTLH